MAQVYIFWKWSTLKYCSILEIIFVHINSNGYFESKNSFKRGFKASWFKKSNLVRWNHSIHIWKLKIPTQTTHILDLKYLVHDRPAPNQMLRSKIAQGGASLMIKQGVPKLQAGVGTPLWNHFWYCCEN